MYAVSNIGKSDLDISEHRVEKELFLPAPKGQSRTILHYRRQDLGDAFDPKNSRGKDHIIYDPDGRNLVMSHRLTIHPREDYLVIIGESPLGNSGRGLVSSIAVLANSLHTLPTPFRDLYVRKKKPSLPTVIAATNAYAGKPFPSFDNHCYGIIANDQGIFQSIPLSWVGELHACEGGVYLNGKMKIPHESICGTIAKLLGKEASMQSMPIKIFFTQDGLQEPIRRR